MIADNLLKIVANRANSFFFFTFLIREDEGKPTEPQKTESTTDGKCSREKRI